MAAHPRSVDTEESDRFSRFVSLSIVVVTIFVALVGVMQSNASRHADRQDVKAQQYLISAADSRVRLMGRATRELETFAAADEDRIHATAPLRSLVPVKGADVALWRKQALAAEAQTGIRRGGKWSLEDDNTFPNRFLADRTMEVDHQVALEDAARSASGAWGKSSSAYTAILTILAVSLYLFGLSLTLAEGVRRLTTLVATALFAVAVFWAAATANSNIKGASEQAAAQYARGVAQLDKGQSAAAVRSLNAAIALRPAFALAYSARSDAVFEAGSPQRDVPYHSLTSASALAQADADMTTALKLGLDNYAIESQLGFYGFQKYLADNDAATLRDSLRHARRAAQLDPLEPIGHYNVALVLLATGNAQAAIDAYKRAILQTLYFDGEKRTRLRNNEPAEEEWVAGALTDLALLEQKRPVLAPQIRTAKELIVGSISRCVATTGECALQTIRTDAKITQVKLEIRPGELGWQADLGKGFDKKNDVLSVQWYYQGASSRVWQGIATTSGVVHPEFGKVQKAVTDDYREKTVTDDYRGYLVNSLPPRCLRGGRYRAEFYVNGHLLLTAAVSRFLQNLDGVYDARLQGGFCHPSNWRFSPLSQSGFESGFVSPDKKRGIFLFRYEAPRAPTPTAAQTLVAAHLRAATARLLGRLAQHGDAIDILSFFMGLGHISAHQVTYRNGKAVAAAGIADDGAILVGIAFGGSASENLRMLATMQYAQRASDRIGEFRDTVVANLPAGWSVETNSGYALFVHNRTNTANMLGSSEAVIIGGGARAFADQNGAGLEARLKNDGYRVLRFEPVHLVGGLRGYARWFTWKPKDNPAVEQIQLYYVENRRGYIFTATSFKTDFAALEPAFKQVFSPIIERWS